MKILKCSLFKCKLLLGNPSELKPYDVIGNWEGSKLAFIPFCSEKLVDVN